MIDRTKFAYLTYNDMLSKIETGEINEYDICYSKDRLVTYLITEDLHPLEIRARVYVFNSISEAETKLNEARDTYTGQVVAVLNDDTYRGYIVNQKNNRYTVAPLWENPGTINYDTLGNRPIVNLIGTLDLPITVSELNEGTYKIKGQYKISNLDETVYLSASDVIIIVENNADSVKIKRITSDDITDYIVTSSGVSRDTYITSSDLNAKIDARINENFSQITTEQINSLFHN